MGRISKPLYEMELEPEAWPVRDTKAVGHIAQGLMLVLLSLVTGRHLLVEGVRHIYRSSAMLAVLVKVSREKRQVVATRGVE